MLKPPVADPAIPSLLQGNESDQDAFFAFCDALDKKAVAHAWLDEQAAAGIRETD